MNPHWFMNLWKDRKSISRKRRNGIEMMTESNLKKVLKTLFSIDDEHLLPITTNWFVPEIKPGTNEDTIGYRIQSKSIREENISEQVSEYHLLENMLKNFLRKFYCGSVMKKQMYFLRNIMFRLTILEWKFSHIR